MKQMDRIMQGVVPGYNHIKRAMPQVNAGRQREQKQTTKKKKAYTLTERDGNKAALRKGVTVAQATRKLAAYEATGLSPQEVLNLMEREQNLTRRIEKLESWEE